MSCQFKDAKIEGVSGHTWSSVLAEVNARLDGSYTLQRPFTTGRQGGAWLVGSPAGQRAVLTWSMNHGLAQRRSETIGLVRRLQDRGYPTPAWIDAGVIDGEVVFELVELAEGTPVGFAELPLRRVIEAIELQAGAADQAGHSWSRHSWSVVHDPNGQRAHLDKLGAQGKAFTHQIDALLKELAGVDLPAGDAVHGDMGTYNILVDQEAIAIVDIGACGPGTRALDYAWLLRQANHDNAPAEVLTRIRAAGQQVAGPEVFTVCLLAAVIEMAAFSAQRGHIEAAAQELRRGRGLFWD